MPEFYDERLLPGLARPFRVGWALWWRSLPRLTLHLVPLAFSIAIISVFEDPTLPTMGKEGGIIMTEHDSQAPSVTNPTVEMAPEVEETTGESRDEIGEEPLSVVGGLAIVLLCLFCIALAGVVLSQRHADLLKGESYPWTLRRFIPWMATWALILFFTFLGSIACIFPGIIIGLRLYWADELALIHGAGPIRALRESWRLTKNATASTFVFQLLVGLAAYPVAMLALLAIMMIALPLELLAELDAVASSIVFTLILAVVLLVLFLAYGATHAVELAYFYGVHAARAVLTPEEAARPDWLLVAKHRAKARLPRE